MTKAEIESFRVRLENFRIAKGIQVPPLTSELATYWYIDGLLDAMELKENNEEAVEKLLTKHLP